MSQAQTYDRAEQLADRMITTYGRLVTFTRGAAPRDPLTQQTSGAPATFTARVVAFPLSAGKAAFLFGSSNVTKPRLELHIALRGLDTIPTEGDRFTWSGRRYALMAPELLDPNGSGAFYARAYAEAA